jgi:dipeptidyl aminopeptidase/acylaminoacyl peptidase
VRQDAELRGDDVVGGAWLHLLDVASGKARLLPFRTKGSYNIRDPAWSPDGRTIYLVEPRRSYPATVTGGALWSVDVAKGTRALVDSSLEILAPSPSPDGHSLAFVANDSVGKAQVWIRALPTGGFLTAADEAELTPRRLRWAGPDTLLVVSGGRFRRLPVAGKETLEVPFVATVAFPRKVTPLPPRHFPAAGSRQPARGQTGLALAPDGSRAAMIALRRLWIIPIPTGEPKEVARLPEGARDVDWAPTMDRVVYAAGSWGAEDLHLMELATGHDVQLTELPGREVVPQWSPDGRWIAFIRVASDSDPHLVVLPVNPDVPDVVDPSRGKDLGPIAAGEWTIGIESATMPTWRRDSRGLLAWRHARGPVVRDPFSILFPSKAEVISLDGKRRKLGGFPLDATWVRWTDDSTLAYVDADRVMRAQVRRLDSGYTGPLGTMRRCI